jgi:hypothetical protein
VKFAKLQMAASSKFSVLFSLWTLFYTLFWTWAFFDRCQVMPPLFLRCLMLSFGLKLALKSAVECYCPCCLDLNAKVLVRYPFETIFVFSQYILQSGTFTHYGRTFYRCIREFQAIWNTRLILNTPLLQKIGGVGVVEGGGLFLMI